MTETVSHVMKIDQRELVIRMLQAAFPFVPRESFEISITQGGDVIVAFAAAADAAMAYFIEQMTEAGTKPEVVEHLPEGATRQ